MYPRHQEKKFHYFSKKHGKFFQGRVIESKLYEVLKEQPNKYIKEVFKSRNEKDEEVIDLKERIVKHIKEAKRLEDKVSRVCEMYAEGDITKDIYKEKLNETKESINYHNTEKVR
ncbi:MAG TPA: hypothetical protein ENI15_13655 [Spirochaetes bacterium]|nr:hypothetical protein [Spirochaetota bacterium]